MRRTILMMSDLQSGAEQMEIVDAASYDAKVKELQAIIDHLLLVHHCQHDLTQISGGTES